jgi:hypothetical protein
VPTDLRPIEYVVRSMAGEIICQLRASGLSEPSIVYLVRVLIDGLAKGIENGNN